MKKIETKKAPAAIGPYVQGNIHNGLLYASGQIPIFPETGEIKGKTIEEQTEQVMENIKQLLIVGGSSFESVVKTTCFLSDMENFTRFNEIYARYFPGNLPARSCVAVAGLPKEVLVEVEVIAVVG